MGYHRDPAFIKDVQLAGISVITFDVGGTLIEPWPSVGHVYAEVARNQGARDISPEILNHRFLSAWRSQNGFSYTRTAWATIVDETFRGLTSRPPSETFFPTLYERFAQANAWRIFDDVEPTLAELARRGIKLGVISNWDERLRPLLEALGLAKYFSFIVVSCEAGGTKPSPTIFQKAVALCGVSPIEILHVGDSMEWDVIGARAAGFKAVQIRRDRKPAMAGELRSLAELL
jgi:putative hydrolase of the HAD superfamily